MLSLQHLYLEHLSVEELGSYLSRH